VPKNGGIHRFAAHRYSIRGMDGGRVNKGGRRGIKEMLGETKERPKGGALCQCISN